MFLSHQQIADNFDRFVPILAHQQRENIHESCLDLRVGDEVYLSGHSTPAHLSDDEPYVVLPPGQFALVKTYERIATPPEYVGLISIRFRYKLQGLTNISGFHVDPNFAGYLIFSVHNVGPNDIRLRYKDAVFMIMWAQLTEPYPIPASFAGQKQREGPSRITLEQMAQLGGATMTISSLREEVKSLALQLKIYGGLAIAALGGILILVLRQLFASPAFR
jgi:dCTP deaminase